MPSSRRGADAKGWPYADLRWSRFRDFDPAKMFEVVGEHAFPFLRDMGGDGSTYSHNMRDARFTIPTPGLLTKVVDLLADLPMDQRDTKGDVYEYMLAKIAISGQNGQFRTPRHIIQLMVEMVAPTPKDTICDPACGTAGFLVSAGEYLKRNHANAINSGPGREHYHRKALHGLTSTTPCCASNGGFGEHQRVLPGVTGRPSDTMNMLLHGVDQPDISRVRLPPALHPSASSTTVTATGSMPRSSRFGSNLTSPGGSSTSCTDSQLAAQLAEIRTRGEIAIRSDVIAQAHNLNPRPAAILPPLPASTRKAPRGSCDKL